MSRQRIRAWVLSPGYQSLVESESSYHRLGRILERLGRSDLEIFTAYRQAAWQVEKRDRERYHRDLGKALSHLLQHIEARPDRGDPESSELNQMLAGEMQRQLAHSLHAEIIQRQLKLIAALRAQD